MTRSSREQDVNDERVTLYQCRGLVAVWLQMALKERVMYVKYGRSLLQPWDRISQGKVAFGMALYGRVEGLT